MSGVVTLDVQVANVSAHGFWVLLGQEELPVPFARFPWFKNATVEQIITVERPSENHLYWPKLDVDLSVESLRNPDAFFSWCLRALPKEGPHNRAFFDLAEGGGLVQ